MNEKTKYSYATLNHVSYGALRTGLEEANKDFVEQLELTAPLEYDELAHDIIDLANKFANKMQFNHDKIDPMITALNFIMYELSIIAPVVWHQTAMNATQFDEQLATTMTLPGLQVLAMIQHIGSHAQRSKDVAELFHTTAGDTIRKIIQGMKAEAEREFAQREARNH